MRTCARENKLNAYFGFIHTGELLRSYPDAAGRCVRIDIVTRLAPPPHFGETFLPRIQQVAAKLGVEVVARVFDEGEPKGN